MEEKINRNILCIDLKSFFASCECIERGKDPFTYPLVVANASQGNGAITLAVTPFLKQQGVKSRGRLFEIPKNIKYVIAKPRMSLYIRKSCEVISILLDYVSKEDLHVYSIDEAFIDVTNYLKLYKMNDIELGVKILKDIFNKTKLTATCGVGPNMLLAKIAMDIEAKHNKNNIAKWTYDDVEEKLWKITPLSDMWGIGLRMERNLNSLGIFSIGDLAKYNKNILKDKFGIIGLEMWRHANGIDNSIISSKSMYIKPSKSYGQSQILFKDYNRNNIRLIIEEMVDTLTRRLRKNNKVTSLISFGVGYSKVENGGFYHSIKLDSGTDNKYEILRICMHIFDNYYKDKPIRKVSISLGNILQKKYIQLSLFKQTEEIEKDNKYNIAIDEIKDKFGKNSLLFASSLFEDSTIIDRNKKIGGHSA